MELENTVHLMLSDNYKNRFIAEYQQLKIRIRQLEVFLKDKGGTIWQDGHPDNIYRKQLYFMRCYRRTLKERAKIERINL
jgi:hypothetical protein